MRSYDDLSTEEKQKFESYNGFMKMYLIVFSWYVGLMLLVGSFGIISAIFISPVHWLTLYFLFALTLVGLVLVFQFKQFIKKREFIYGITEGTSLEHFFGIMEKDYEVKISEMLKRSPDLDKKID